MRTRVSGSKHIYYTPDHPEEHCSDQGHVWTWDRRNTVHATGAQRPDARCDCGEALWKDVLTKMAKPNRVADVCPKCGKGLRHSLNGRERACPDRACAWYDYDGVAQNDRQGDFPDAVMAAGYQAQADALQTDTAASSLQKVLRRRMDAEVTAERERIAAWLERQQVNGWSLKSLADDLRRNDL